MLPGTCVVEVVSHVFGIVMDVEWIDVYHVLGTVLLGLFFVQKDLLHALGTALAVIMDTLLVDSHPVFDRVLLVLLHVWGTVLVLVGVSMKGAVGVAVSPAALKNHQKRKVRTLTIGKSQNITILMSCDCESVQYVLVLFVTTV